MSERITPRTALAPYAANLPAQVQKAGRQLAIAGHLIKDIERARLVAFLKQISSDDAISIISRTSVLIGEMISLYEDHWNWRELSTNTALPWAPELLDRFEDHWDWMALSPADQLSMTVRPVRPTSTHRPAGRFQSTPALCKTAQEEGQRSAVGRAPTASKSYPPSAVAA